MGVGDTAALAGKQPHSSSNSQQQQQQQQLAKRRSRGNVYGRHLWGADPTLSGELAYVQRHGDARIHKVLHEDENWKYVSLKQVHDVRLYTPIATPEDDAPPPSSTATASSSPAAEQLVDAPASAGGRTLSSTSSAASMKDRTSAPPLSSSSSHQQQQQRMLPGRCDFRAMTRVAGSLDTVMAILAADDDRDAYWTALNTQKGLRASHVFTSARLAADDNDSVASFPRWSQRYMATRFTKYATKSVDACYAEYATIARRSPGDTPRGFIYRRSIDESLFDTSAIQARLAKYDDACERMYIQDWLYEVSETNESGVCKVVLTTSVYFSGDYSRSLRTEFHEFSTDILIQLRKVLSKHWQARQSNDASSNDVTERSTATTLLTHALSGTKPGQARFCRVCSATFSLLRKRYTCRTCVTAVCSKCAPIVPKVKGVTLPAVDNSGTGSTRECTLCVQFRDETTTSRSSVRPRFVANAIVSPLSATAYDDDCYDDVDICASSSDGSNSNNSESVVYTSSSSNRSILSAHDVARKLFSASASATMKARRTQTPGVAMTPTPTSTATMRKPRNGSTDSTTSATSSVPDTAAGVVLFSDLDALALGGRSTKSQAKRPIRTVSEDNVLHARDSSSSNISNSVKATQAATTSGRKRDDLANFNLKLL